MSSSEATYRMKVKCDFCEATDTGNIDDLTDRGWQRAVFHAPKRITITGCHNHKKEFMYLLKYNMMSKAQKEEVDMIRRKAKGRGAFLEWKVDTMWRRVDVCDHCWANKDCKGNSDTCCVSQLFKLTKYATPQKIIEFCCQSRCNDNQEYHTKKCPIHLCGIGQWHTQKKQKPPEPLPIKDDKGHLILRLTDFLGKKTLSKALSKTKSKLFVPLSAEFYMAFEKGDKTWELRGIKNQFNEQTVFTGKEVTLSLGYNTPHRLHGRVGEVKTFDTIDEALESIIGEKIIPPIIHQKKIESMKSVLMLNYNKFIAFEVILT